MTSCRLHAPGLCIHVLKNTIFPPERFIAKTARTAFSRAGYKIVPLTNLNKYLYTDKNEIKVNININKSSEKIGKDKTEQKHSCTRQRKENFTFRAQTHSHSLSRPILYCRIAHNEGFCTALNLRHKVWFSRTCTSVSCKLWGKCNGSQKVNETHQRGHVLVQRPSCRPYWAVWWQLFHF
jgi:hypothetical protein